MIRNLKALGLAMVAVFAMSAVVASSASASANGKFTASSYPVHIFGTDNNDTFTAVGETISCTENSFTAVAEEKTSEITVTPHYTKCGLTTVTMNGCHYTFHAPDPPATNGTVDLECPTEAPVEVHKYTSSAHTTPNCTITVFEETGLESVTFRNVANGDVEVSGTVEGINGQTHGTCSFGLTVNFSNGIYHAGVTVEGTGNNNIDVG